MFVRTKTRINKDGSKVEYLQIVENTRIDGKVRQHVICTLGRLDQLQEERQIDRLVEGLVRFTKEQALLKAAEETLMVEWSKELGLDLIFRRFWEQSGLKEIIESRLAKRKIEFNAAEAIFAMVLNRLTDPMSKIKVADWVANDVYDPNFEGIETWHYYRALDFLSENKDRIEEELFFRGRNLFNQSVDLVFFDTTSVYFEGLTGAEELCTYGYSKDRRPDRVQVIIGLLVDQDGIPIGHEVMPGNTADVEAFMKMLKSCKERFNLRRVIVVGDRGIVSKKTIQAVEEAGYEYIFGVKMRKNSEVKEEVLSRAGRYQAVGDNLKVKNVVVEGNRYVICYNPEEARRDAEAREEIINGLKKKIAQQGVKGLVGNRGYARYLKVNNDMVEINEEVIAEEARYDGKYILKTNTDLPAEEVALAYKQLWKVERAFRECKSNLEIRPMYHWTEARIRGHIMICFIAFYLEMLFQKRLKEIKPDASSSQVLRDLSRLRATKIRNGNRVAIVRSELSGEAHLAFKAARMQIPQRVLYENVSHHR